MIPIYTISKVTNQEPTIGMIMGYNLANHLAIAIMLALTVFFFLSYLKIRTAIAFGFSLIPIFLELLLPSPMYYFQNSFYTDEAVILPFVIAVFLEVIRDRFEDRPKRIIDLVQGLVFFYGVFTDWFFIFIAVVIYAKRLLAREYDFRDKKAFFYDTLSFAIAPETAIVMFLIHSVFVMQGDTGMAISYLKEKYLYRAGTHEGDSIAFGKYFQEIMDHIDKGYGLSGRIILFVSLIFVVGAGIYLFAKAQHKKHKKQSGGKAPKKNRKSKFTPVPVDYSGTEAQAIVLLSFVLLVPCFLQIFAFMNHSAVHDFSALKLSVPMAIVPFVLVPLFIGITLRDKKKNFDLQKGMLIIMLISLLSAGTYLAFTYGGYREYFANRNEYWYSIIGFTNAHTEPRDVVFFPEMEVPYHPPQLVSLTMKRVYMIRSLDDIFNTLKNATGDYRVVLILRKKPSPGSFWDRAASLADSSLQAEAYYLYFSPESIRKLKS